jgi:glycosyltransferase involved in cell wall biosynthesis
MALNNKKIWIVSIYTSPPPFDSHLRHNKFAQYLQETGYDVSIITSSFLPRKKIDLIQNKRKYIQCVYDGIEYIHIKTPHYTGNGLVRMFSIFIFALRLMQLRNKFVKPDMIIHNAHIPFDILISRCARKLKAKYIVEVWDLWPESFVAFGLIGKNNPLLKLAYRMEKAMYGKSDRIVFSMEGGKDYIIKKGWDIGHGGPVDLNKIHYINNGIDIKAFEENKEKYQLRDEDLDNDGIFKVIYLGSIKLANDLKLLIDAASLLKNHSTIKFLIYGDGTERAFLENYCLENSIDNVLFKEKWIEPKYVPFILSKSSLNILNYKSNTINQFGGSQGKLFQYLGCGKPICSNQVMGYDPILKYNLGIAEEFKSAREYADAVLKIYEMNSQNYKDICDRSLNAAKEYDYRILSNKLIKMCNEL